MRNTQRTAAGTFAPQDTAERFWSKVDKGGDGGCWRWTGNLSDGGYGRFWTKAPGEKVKSHQAHRWAYEQLVGPIPDGMTLDHLCHERQACSGGDGCPHRRCVNPQHLAIAPMGENVNRGNPNWRQRLSRTHCPKGHPFDEKNTYHAPDGSRHCRACGAANARRYKAARRRRTPDRS